MPFTKEGLFVRDGEPPVRQIGEIEEGKLHVRSPDRPARQVGQIGTEGLFVRDIFQGGTIR